MLALKLLLVPMFLLVVSLAGRRWGAAVAGWLAGLPVVFPILGIVLAVFSHVSHGPVDAAALLRAMATGLYAFVAFCFVLALSLPGLGVAAGFLAATAASLTVQGSTLRRFARAPRP